MKTIEVQVEEVEKVTAHALLLNIGGERHWIPKSQIEFDGAEWDEGDSGTLSISEWIAGQKDIG